ncbi:hypothetical protein KIPB_006350, partial [Kipferlia bialata]
VPRDANDSESDGTTVRNGVYSVPLTQECDHPFLHMRDGVMETQRQCTERWFQTKSQGRHIKEYVADNTYRAGIRYLKGINSQILKHSIDRIDAKYGGTVSQYFTFLRSMIILNSVIAGVWVLTIILPLFMSQPEVKAPASIMSYFTWAGLETNPYFASATYGLLGEGWKDRYAFMLVATYLGLVIYTITVFVVAMQHRPLPKHVVLTYMLCTIDMRQGGDKHRMQDSLRYISSRMREAFNRQKSEHGSITNMFRLLSKVSRLFITVFLMGLTCVLWVLAFYIIVLGAAFSSLELPSLLEAYLTLVKPFIISIASGVLSVVIQTLTKKGEFRTSQSSHVTVAMIRYSIYKIGLGAFYAMATFSGLQGDVTVLDKDVQSTFALGTLFFYGIFFWDLFIVYALNAFPMVIDIVKGSMARYKARVAHDREVVEALNSEEGSTKVFQLIAQEEGREKESKHAVGYLGPKTGRVFKLPGRLTRILYLEYCVVESLIFSPMIIPYAVVFSLLTFFIEYRAAMYHCQPEDMQYGRGFIPRATSVLQLVSLIIMFTAMSTGFAVFGITGVPSLFTFL